MKKCSAGPFLTCSRTSIFIGDPVLAPSMQQVSKCAKRAGEQVLSENLSWPICPGMRGFLGQIFQTYQPPRKANAIGGVS